MRGEDALGPTVRAVALWCVVMAVCSAIAHVASAQKLDATDVAERAKKARQVTQTLADRLKGELAAALKSDGAVSTIGLCQTISPDLTNSAADEFGFEVTRTALKLRNPENAPDPWELDILQQFQKQIAAGADPAKIEHAEVIVTPEGDKLFRYMKPIMTGEPCLVCHGTDVKQDVKAEIARYYPEDKALGFKLGELRGAFSLAQLIGE